jgi:hypothetical protein
MLRMVTTQPFNSRSLKSKLLTATAVIAAAVGGFWFGQFRTTGTWHRVLESEIESCLSLQYRSRAQTTLRVLTYTHNGQQSNANDVLERELDQLLGNLGILCEAVPPQQRNPFVLRAIREARDYRLQHPWTNSVPSDAKRVREVLHLAD